VCEYCFGSDWQCPDENDKDALRAWLDPWRDTSDPPEHDQEVIIKKGYLQAKARYADINGMQGYSVWIFGMPTFTYASDVDGWRELPPLPKEA